MRKDLPASILGYLNFISALILAVLLSITAGIYIHKNQSDKSIIAIVAIVLLILFTGFLAVLFYIQIVRNKNQHARPYWFAAFIPLMISILLVFDAFTSLNEYYPLSLIAALAVALLNIFTYCCFILLKNIKQNAS